MDLILWKSHDVKCLKLNFFEEFLVFASKNLNLKIENLTNAIERQDDFAALNGGSSSISGFQCSWFISVYAGVCVSW